MLSMNNSSVSPLSPSTPISPDSLASPQSPLKSQMLTPKAE